MKLIPMTDFVLDQHDNNPKKFGDYTDMSMCIFKYAKFLKQPLKLEMFVPCDEEGIVLEEQKEDHHFMYANGLEFYPHQRVEYNLILQKSKEKVLFEGFEHGYLKGIHRLEDSNFKAHLFNNFEDYFHSRELKKVEDIIKWGLTLTPSAINLLTQKL